VTFAALEFLSDLARAQGAHARNLVVLYLSGGNDSLSMLIPYNEGVRGGLYGSAPVLSTDPKNPTLENNAGDVAFETDFRSVYARVADNWLGTDSTQLLGGNFRRPDLAFI
jgi:uncharacterized protein (DUF1501 family)